MRVYLGNHTNIGNIETYSRLSPPRLSYRQGSLSLRNFGNFNFQNKTKKLRFTTGSVLLNHSRPRDYFRTSNFLHKKSSSPEYSSRINMDIRSPKSKSNSSFSHFKGSGNNDALSFTSSSDLIECLHKSNFNIDDILYTKNFEALERNLDLLVFSEFPENSENSDNCTKIVKTFQQISQYLLEIQSNLGSETYQYEDEYNKLTNESEFLEAELKQNKIKIHEYKNKNTRIQNRMRIYKRVISAPVSNRRNYFFCNFCPDKKFSSSKKLVEHTERRHCNNNNINFREENNIKNSDEEKIQITVENLIESKISKFKDEIQNSLTNFHKENMQNLIENQNILEKKIDQKALYISEDKIKNLENLVEEIHKIKSAEAMEAVERASTLYTPFNDTKKFNEIILEMSNKQNERIYFITEQLVKFKESILTEIKEIKSSAKSDSKYCDNPYLNRRPSEISEIKPLQNTNNNEAIHMGTPSKNIFEDFEIKNCKNSKNSKNTQMNNMMNNHRPSEEINFAEKERVLTERNSSIFIPTENADNYNKIPETDNILPSKSVNLIHPHPHPHSSKEPENEQLEETVNKEEINSIKNYNIKNGYIDQNEIKQKNVRKMKNIFSSFIQRDENKLFSQANANANATLNSNNSMIKKENKVNFIYSTIPEIEIVIADHTKLNSEMDNLFNVFLKNYSVLNPDIEKSIDNNYTTGNKIKNLNLEKLREIELPKELLKIVEGINSTTEKQSNKMDYYMEYMENIYKVLDLKSFLSDTKIFGKKETRETNLNNELIKNSDKNKEKEKSLSQISISVKDDSICSPNAKFRKLPLPAPSLFNPNNITSKISNEKNEKNHSVKAVKLKESIQTKETAKFNEVIDIDDEFAI